MASTLKDTILQFDEFKKKFGHTEAFKELEKKYDHDIKFLKFRQKHNLQWSKKNGWNKQFYPTTKNIWIKDRKNYNKGLRKYGYYQTVQTGWKLGKDDSILPKCLWCGKLLEGKQTKFCSISSHKKLFSKVVGIGKQKYGFIYGKDSHLLLIPRLWDYTTTHEGTLTPNRTKTNRIEFKDIEFVINGKRYPLTKKSRTP